MILVIRLYTFLIKFMCFCLQIRPVERILQMRSCERLIRLYLFGALIFLFFIITINAVCMSDWFNYILVFFQEDFDLFAVDFIWSWGTFMHTEQNFSFWYVENFLTPRWALDLSYILLQGFNIFSALDCFESLANF